MPVIASHAGYRFGEQDYMLDDATLDRIRRRNGVVGLIMAQYQLNDGLVEGHTKTFAPEARTSSFATSTRSHR